MGEEILGSGEDQKRLSFGMQVVSIGQDSILQLAERLCDQSGPEEEARGQSGKVQEGGGDHEEQVQTNARRPELVQCALHRRHEQRVQKMRRVREGAVGFFRAKVRQTAHASQHIRQDEHRRDLLGHVDNSASD